MGILTRTRLELTPVEYFKTVDRKDLDGSLAFFEEGATFTIQSAGRSFSGHGEIASMFRKFFADYAKIVHSITNIVVDERASKCATEQHCPHIRNDGTPDVLTTCNFFSFARNGRFQRVIIWIDGANPLVGE